MTDEQMVQYESQGFLHLPGVIDSASLARFQNAFEAVVRKYADQLQQPTKVAYFDFPRILDEDDIFVDLADLPTLFPTLLGILGGDIQLLQTQARILRPGPSHTPPWHSDMTGIKGINLSQTPNFHLKVHFYPYDLLPNQGCLAFLPGSHRYPDGFERPNIAPDTASSVMKKIVPKAGDAVVFNTHVLHMATDNDSAVIRKSLIYSYSHFWVKNTVSGVPKDLGRLAITPQRKQLFGQPTTFADPPFFQSILESENSSGLKGIVSAGQHLLRRTLETYSQKMRAE